MVHAVPSYRNQYTPSLEAKKPKIKQRQCAMGCGTWIQIVGAKKYCSACASILIEQRAAQHYRKVKLKGENPAMTDAFAKLAVITPQIRTNEYYDTSRGMSVQMMFFYYHQLVRGESDALPEARLERDVACHAAWHYFTVALRALERAKRNLVMEGEPDQGFNPRQLFTSVANMYGVDAKDMGRFWPVVAMQRMALGFSANADLLDRMKFRD